MRQTESRRPLTLLRDVDVVSGHLPLRDGTNRWPAAFNSISGSGQPIESISRPFTAFRGAALLADMSLFATNRNTKADEVSQSATTSPIISQYCDTRVNMTGLPKL